MNWHSSIRQTKTIGINFIAIIIALAFIFPLYYLLVSSLKSVKDLWHDPFLWLFHPTFENFIALFRTRSFGLYYANSLIVVLANVALSLLLATPAAYGLARCNLRGRDNISFWMLSQLMLPPIAGLVPFYMGS